MSVPDDLVGVARAARELNVSLGTVRRWADSGFVRCARTPAVAARTVEHARGRQMLKAGEPVEKAAAHAQQLNRGRRATDGPWLEGEVFG